MADEMSFERILARCLGRVPADIDKREGSLIYDALAPAAAELAAAFQLLQTLKDDYAFPDTVAGVNLTKKAAERGVNREAATYALRKGTFYDQAGNLFEVPLGGRYSGGDLNFSVLEKISAGVYRLRCETPGTGGNRYFGPLIPIEYLHGLGSARLEDLLVPGEDEESDDALRKRYFASLAGEAFGGNIQDYKRWTLAVPGIGGVRVYPVWQGGGSVRLVVQASDWGLPSAELVQAVQNEIDPEEGGGTGLGMAPIGHRVRVEPAQGVEVEVETSLTFKSGWSWERVKPAALAALEEYLRGLRQHWAEVDAVTLRVSQVENRLLNLEGVLDISGTTLNGGSRNLALLPDELPLLGRVVHL